MKKPNLSRTLHRGLAMILAFALGGLLDMVRYTGADVGDGSYGWEQRLADMDTAG